MIENGSIYLETNTTYIFKVEMNFRKETLAVNFVHGYYDHTDLKYKKKRQKKPKLNKIRFTIWNKVQVKTTDQWDRH